tara:strand:+ start:170 stop:922 length:753 start_codon:yes stop_codon:yes gene_type:complete
MGTFEDFLNKIKFDQGLRFDQEVAQFMGIDKRSLAVAKARGSLPIKYINWYCEYYKIKRVEFETHITNKQNEETEEMSTTLLKDHIELQKEKIIQLENDLEKMKQKPFQSSQWNALDYHFYSVLKISYSFPNKLTRKMTQLDNRDKIEHYLGYNQEEIDKHWDIGTLYKKFNDHPVNAIVSKQSLEAIDDKVKTMPTLFESLKDMIGNFYIPIPISFVRKDGSIQHSVTYNKIDWIGREVFTKTQFILDD